MTGSYDPRVGKLNPTVERALTDFLEREINLHLKSESLKIQIKGRYDWNLNSAFNCCDTTNEGFLNTRNIQSFLRLNGHFATDEELIAIVRRLDADADQIIKYQEFCDGVSPVIGFMPTVHNNKNLTSILNRSQSPLRSSFVGNRSSKKLVRFEEGGSRPAIYDRNSPISRQQPDLDVSYGFRKRENSPLRGRQPSPQRSSPIRRSFAGQKTPPREIYTREGSPLRNVNEMSNRYSNYNNMSGKTSVIRMLAQGTEKKKDRM